MWITYNNGCIINMALATEVYFSEISDDVVVFFGGGASTGTVIYTDPSFAKRKEYVMELLIYLSKGTEHDRSRKGRSDPKRS